MNATSAATFVKSSVGWSIGLSVLMIVAGILAIASPLAAGIAFGGDFVYVGRERSLAEYRRVGTRLSPAERLRNAARQLAQLPWFARNVLIKVALVLRARPLLRLLGHGSSDWPY